MRSKAYEQGRKVGQRDGRIAACPYLFSLRPAERLEWSQGYAEGSTSATLARTFPVRKPQSSET